MPTYSRCIEKGLVYIIIITPLSRQPSFYAKCIKSNMYLFCDVRSVSNAKCTCLMRSYVLRNLRLPYLICLRVLYNGYYRETQLRALSCLK